MQAVADKKLIEAATEEISMIAGQKASSNICQKKIFLTLNSEKKCLLVLKLLLRRERMYEFLERLIAVSLPRIRDFNGISDKFDGQRKLYPGYHRTNYFS